VLLRSQLDEPAPPDGNPGHPDAEPLTVASATELAEGRVLARAPENMEAQCPRELVAAAAAGSLPPESVRPTQMDSLVFAAQVTDDAMLRLDPDVVVADGDYLPCAARSRDPWMQLWQASLVAGGGAYHIPEVDSAVRPGPPERDSRSRVEIVLSDSEDKLAPAAPNENSSGAA
jgi:hypothetical protein